MTDGTPQDEAEMYYESVINAVEDCFTDGPISGVLITYDNSTGEVNVRCINHDYTRVVTLLLRAVHTMHERLMSARMSNSFNVH